MEASRTVRLPPVRLLQLMQSSSLGVYLSLSSYLVDILADNILAHGMDLLKSY